MHNPARFIKLLLLLAVFIVSCGEKPEPVRRVLLITLDTVRADALRCYGLPPQSADTPNLDRLAAEGTLFQRAVCQIPATLTSHTAILTGLRPRSSGVRFASDSVPKEVMTITEVMKDAGFSTAAFLSAAVLNKTFGLDQGFDCFDDLSDRTAQVNAERSGKDTTDLAIEWLAQRQPNESFFLWVHYYDAHSPYQPEPEDDVYGPQNYSGPIDGSADQITRMIASKGAELTQTDLERLRSLYLAEVAMVDHEVGRLIDSFDHVCGASPNLIVTLADHGENLGEGGRFFHGADLYESSMHIPLIIRWPEQRHSGSKISNLACAMDVAPTILSVCKLKSLEGIDGMNLEEFLQIESKEQPIKERFELIETENAYICDADKTLGVTSLQWKLIDRRKQRRSPVLVGRALGYPLTRSCYLRAMVKGDVTAALVAHIRYHAADESGSGTIVDLENQPTIMVRTDRFGTDVIHLKYDLPPVPEGWKLLATTDLYERAVSYGVVQGWPVDNIQIESIAVDVGGIPGQWKVDVYIDDVMLVGEDSLLIDDFETSHSQLFRDAGVGVKHVAGSRIEPEQGIAGGAALRVVAQYPAESNPWSDSELYEFTNPLYPCDELNLLRSNESQSSVQKADALGAIIDDWLKHPPASLVPPALIDPQLDESLRSLGYL